MRLNNWLPLDCLSQINLSPINRSPRDLLLLALMLVLCSGPAIGQVLPIPPPVGPIGEIVLSPPQRDEAVIYHVGLIGLLNKASLQQIEITLSALAPPLVAAFDSGDIETLRLVESANHVYGDAADVVLTRCRRATSLQVGASP